MSQIDERITEAWRSGGAAALHRAAEELAGQGYEESAIYDALEKLLLAERAAGADDETEDRITDVMERLTGWCHESGHIHTRRPSLPTPEEIAKLPRWARVALAARCARRALPVFRMKWPDAPSQLDNKLIAAVELAELSASAAGHRTDVVDYARAATLAAYVSDAALNAARDRDRAAQVINATIAVFPKLKDVPVDWFDQAILIGIHNASMAIAAGIATDQDTAHAAAAWAERLIRHDYERLAELAERKHWDNDTPVPPDVFGAMWPEGIPPGWPTDPDSPQHAQRSVTV